MRLSFMALLCVAGSVRAEDVDNPEFMSWSKFTKGTSISVKTTTTIEKRVSVSTTTTKLIEVGDGKVQLATMVNTPLQGKDNWGELPPRTLKKDSPFILMTEDKGKNGKPRGTYEEGTETLKVGENEIKTKWYKSSWVDPAGTKAEAKHWLSDEVPGGLVRMLSTVTPKTPNSPKYQLDRELTEFIKK